MPPHCSPHPFPMHRRGECYEYAIVQATKAQQRQNHTWCAKKCIQSNIQMHAKFRTGWHQDAGRRTQDAGSHHEVVTLDLEICTHAHKRSHGERARRLHGRYASGSATSFGAPLKHRVLLQPPQAIIIARRPSDWLEVHTKLPGSLSTAYVFNHVSHSREASTCSCRLLHVVIRQRRLLVVHGCSK